MIAKRQRQKLPKLFCPFAAYIFYPQPVPLTARHGILELIAKCECVGGHCFAVQLQRQFLLCRRLTYICKVFHICCYVACSACSMCIRLACIYHILFSQLTHSIETTLNFSLLLRINFIEFTAIRFCSTIVSLLFSNLEICWRNTSHQSGGNPFLPTRLSENCLLKCARAWSEWTRYTFLLLRAKHIRKYPKSSE